MLSPDAFHATNPSAKRRTSVTPMRTAITAFCVVCLVALGTVTARAADTSAAKAKITGIVVHAGDESVTSLKLRGADARHQLLVTAKLDDGMLRDVTHDAKFDVSPASVAKVTSDGLLLATGNGSATVTAHVPGGQSATLTLTVEQFETKLPINFANQIVPIFTKSGCNSGGCHGKSGGQNGFRLSLLGF